MIDFILYFFNEIPSYSLHITWELLINIFQALRFSKVGPLIKDLDEMLDILTEQIDRLSIPSCLHIAIIGSGMIHYHEKSMVKAIQKIISSIENVEEVR